MNASRQRPLVSATLVALSCIAMTAFAGGRDDDRGHHGKEPPLTVPKARCGPHDKPETALQGQVPAALRAAGFKGFNCNLELIGQSRGDGGNWQTTQFRERAAQASPSAQRASPPRSRQARAGVRLSRHGITDAESRRGAPTSACRSLDITDPRRPTQTAQLTTTSMLDPWESLKVNERRQLLAADNGQNGGGGPEIDIYDISDDCRYPQLLASIRSAPAADGGVVAPVIGHEGSFAPDGLTYYGGDLSNAQYYAVDTTNPREPKMLAAWKPGIVQRARHVDQR